MKRILLFAAVATMFAACTKNTEDTKVIAPAFDKLHVTIDDTRVELQNGITVWNEGDQVSVFNKTTGNEQWLYVGETGSTNGDLVKVSGTAAITGDATEKVVALYPYDKTAAISGTSVTTTVPAAQTYKSGSFGNGSVMTAISNDENLSFKNILGYIKLSVTGTDAVKSITLKGNNGETLAGAVTIDAEALTAAATDNTINAITLDCGDGVQLSDAAVDFYIGVIPQTFSKGITVTVETADGNSTEKSTENSLTVERNHIVPFKAIEAGAPALECEISIILGYVSVLYPSYSASFPDDTSLLYAIFPENEAIITKLNMALVETAQITALGLTDQEVMDILGDSQTDASSILDSFNKNQGYIDIFTSLTPETEYTFIVTATNEYGKSTIVSTKYTTAAAQDYSDYKGELVIGQYYMTYTGNFTSENTFTIVPSGDSTTEFIIKQLGWDNGTSWHGEYDPATSKFTVSGLEVGYESYGNQFGTIWGYANSAHTQVLVYWSGYENGSDPCVFSVDPATKQICQLDTYLSTDVYSYSSNKVGNMLGSYTEFGANTPVTLVGAAASAKSASAKPCKLYNSGIKPATVKGGVITDKKAALKSAKSAAIEANAAALR